MARKELNEVVASFIPRLCRSIRGIHLVPHEFATRLLWTALDRLSASFQLSSPRSP